MKLQQKHLVVCVATLLISSTQAGTVEQATIVAEPQMQVKDGEIQGCGYRLKSIPKSFSGLSSVVILDASFNLYSQGMVLLKGGAVQVSIKAGELGPATNKQIESFWLKVQSENPTTALNGKVLAAETMGYLMYVESVGSVAKLFKGVAEGIPVTVGMRVKGEAVDRIYTGVVHLSDEDKEQGNHCLADLVKQMESEVTPAPADR